MNLSHTRTLGAALAAAGIVLGGIAIAPQAHAEEATTKVVTWTITSTDGDRFGTPQTLFAGDVTACGVGPFQQDTYRYDTDEHRAIVDALIAKGTLASSKEDSKVWISNVDIPATAACETAPPVATSPPTESPSPSPTPSATSTPTPTTPAPAQSSTPTPVASHASPAPTSSATPVAATGNGPDQTQPKTGTDQASNELAYTGTNNGPLFGGAALLLGVGSILIAIARRKRRA